jgi:hypothetical protein
MKWELEKEEKGGDGDGSGQTNRRSSSSPLVSLPTLVSP